MLLRSIHPRYFIFFSLLALIFAAGCSDGSVSVDGHGAGEDAQTSDTFSPDAAAPGQPEDVAENDDTSADPDAPDAAGEDGQDPTETPDATDEPEDARSPEEPEDASSPEEPEEPDTPPAPQTFVLWMAPDGVDSRDGKTQANAVKTLTRVHEILKAESPQVDVEVRIAPGRYRGQKVVWTFSVPDHTVKLTRLAGQDDRPVFDGCLSNSNCPGGTWFILNRSDGAKTNIIFNYLRVENYQTAISLNGNRNAESKSNGGNRVFGCYFDRIGNIFNSSVDPSTAAIRLVNSDDNEIINNHFVNIINTRSPGILHAIYAAHMSDRNQILRNRFENNAGDPVRFRDYSNDNIISDNRFIKSGIEAGYTEWYCDHDARSDCTKATPECPSWGNQFRDNELNGNYACGQLGVFKYFQSDTTSGCSPPSAEAKRLRTSGNTHTSTPCQ